jgi:outer membrane protein OmpA-like peptidoglycan-associated protein
MESNKVITNFSIGIRLIFIFIAGGCASKEATSVRERSFFERNDSTALGVLAGAAIGGGGGAIIGHQLSYAGEGLGIGAGLGALAGLSTGSGLDSLQEEVGVERARLDRLEVANDLNTERLKRVQAYLDEGGSSEKLKIPQATYQVFFGADVTSLRGGYLNLLESVADSVKRNPYLSQVIITGHSDSEGGAEYAKKLSEERAASVADFFVNRGVSRDRLTIKSHGDEKPLAGNDSEHGRGLNRRVDIVIKNRG